MASRWARDAQPGDTIDVTVLGSNCTLPEPRPAGCVIVGDTASLPAINSLLDAIGDAPAQVFLEAGHDDDKELPVARSSDITWVDRKNAGEALVEAARSSAIDASDHFGWVACDNRTTRAVAKVFREDYKSRVNRLRRRHIGWPERHRQPSWKVSCSYQAVAST